MPPFTGGYCLFCATLVFFQPGEILRCKRARIDVGKRRALKVRFQRPGDRAVKNGLAADAISTDRRAVFRRLGRIQLVTANAGDCRNAGCSRSSRCRAGRPGPRRRAASSLAGLRGLAPPPERPADRAGPHGSEQIFSSWIRLIMQCSFANIQKSRTGDAKKRTSRINQTSK